MKTIFTSIALLFTLCLQAQDFSVKKGSLSSDDAMADAWMIELGEDIKFAQKTFKDYAKEQLDIKARNDGRYLLVAKEVSLPALSDKRGDLKIHFTPAGDSITAGIAFVQGYDIFINADDNPEGMMALRKITRDYLKYYYEAYYADIIEENERELKDLNRELARSEKKIDKLKRNSRKVSRKLDREGEADVRARYHERNANNEAGINKLTDKIPELKASIQQAKVELAKAENDRADVNNKIELYSKVAVD